MAWRFTETTAPLEFSIESAASWLFATMEAFTLVSSTMAWLWLSRTSDRKTEATANGAWWGVRRAPRVDIYIPTFNEDRNILERTIAGAKCVTYPNARVFVLDDGRRTWLAELCSGLRVGYFTRPDNAHAKAGNINHAFLARMKDLDPPDFIAILDADFVPHRDFVSRALALFHDPKVGIVQTPQYFFNPDPIQHNLGITENYPDEQRFFFDHVEPARDAWGVAICCGTSSMTRATALLETGGLPTESVTEDYLLTLKFAEHGWKTVYLTEALTEGLAPEGMQEYIVQRGRWCLGFMQIIRNVYNPLDFRNGLSLRWRLGLADSFFYWFATFPFRLAAMICPLLYWWLGIVTVDASVSGILEHFVPYYAATLISLNYLSRGLIMPLVVDVSQLIVAAPITRALWTGLIWKGPHKFHVTAKGGNRRKIVVQTALMKPFAILFGLTVIGLCIPLLTDYVYPHKAGDGVIVILFWTLYNIGVLATAMLACVERPRPPHSMRIHSEPVYVELRGRLEAGWATEISGSQALIRGPTRLPVEELITLHVENVGAIQAAVASRRSDGYVLDLFPNPNQREALFAKLHTVGGAPGAVHGRLAGVMEGILWSLLTLAGLAPDKHHSGK